MPVKKFKPPKPNRGIGLATDTFFVKEGIARSVIQSHQEFGYTLSPETSATTNCKTHLI